MTDTVVLRVEQLATRDRQLASLDFTFGMGIVVRDIINDPDNEAGNEIESPIVEVVDTQDVVKCMEDNGNYGTNNDDSRDTD